MLETHFLAIESELLGDVMLKLRDSKILGFGMFGLGYFGLTLGNPGLFLFDKTIDQKLGHQVGGSGNHLTSRSDLEGESFFVGAN